MLDDSRTTMFARQAVIADDIIAEARLLSIAERGLRSVAIESGAAWRNLTIVAQLARVHNSPVLAMAREIAIRNSDNTKQSYDRALRDMVLVESDESLRLIRCYLTGTGAVGYYIAKRSSHIAAEQDDVCILRECSARLAYFDGQGSLSFNPHINWMIASALLDRALGRPVDRESLCARIRTTGYHWRRYCREINAVLGRVHGDTCARCIVQMSRIPQLETDYLSSGAAIREAAIRNPRQAG